MHHALQVHPWWAFYWFLVCAALAYVNLKRK
jgi:hypothetical protein